MCTGAVFYKAVLKGDLFPYAINDQCIGLSMHQYTVATQVPESRSRFPLP
jgi:hypothetical protein